MNLRDFGDTSNVKFLNGWLKNIPSIQKKEVRIGLFLTKNAEAVFCEE